MSDRLCRNHPGMKAWHVVYVVYDHLDIDLEIITNLSDGLNKIIFLRQ